VVSKAALLRQTPFFQATCATERKTSTGQPLLSADAQVLTIALSMSKARFQQTKMYLHLAGNTALHPDNKMAELFKLCPTHFSKGVEKFCRGCFAPLVMGLVKIYIKKTIPFGHKLWVLVFNEGYPSLFVWLCKLGERLVLSHCWPMLQAHLASQFMQGNFSYIWQSSLITVSLLQER